MRPFIVHFNPRDHAMTAGGKSRLAALVMAFWLLVSCSAAEPPLPSPEQVRQAVRISLPFLEAGADKWKAKTFGAAKNQCVSCHHLPFAIWTHREAKAHGLPVNDAKVTDWADWSLTFSAQRKYKDEMVDGFLDTMVLCRQSLPADEPALKAFQLFTELLAHQQLPDGSWMVQDRISTNEPGFQIVAKSRPPAATPAPSVPGVDQSKPEAQREATQVDTLWTLLGVAALERLGDRLPAETRQTLLHSRQRALSFLKDAPAGRRSDWLAWQMLITREYGEARRVPEWREALLHQQNADGGWGLAKGDASHALVTGQCLYALSLAGINGDQPAAQRAWKYLLGTQRDDGSWKAPSRLESEKFNYVTIYWGTAWATVGMLASLPATPAASVASPGPARE